jgi:hypothetical protein
MPASASIRNMAFSITPRSEVLWSRRDMTRHYSLRLRDHARGVGGVATFKRAASESLPTRGGPDHAIGRPGSVSNPL